MQLVIANYTFIRTKPRIVAAGISLIAGDVGYCCKCAGYLAKLTYSYSYKILAAENEKFAAHMRGLNL